MKVIYICLLALIGSTLAAKTKMRSKGFLETGDQIVDTAVNANFNDDVIINPGINAALDIEKEASKSFSGSNKYSEDLNSDSQEIDVSINFNVDLDNLLRNRHHSSSSSSSSSCSSSYCSYCHRRK